MKHTQTIVDLPLEVRAEIALKEAVAQVIEEYRRTGEPLVIWRDGHVVLLPPDQAGVKQTPALPSA